MNDYYRNPKRCVAASYYDDDSRCRSSYIAIAVCAVLLILTIISGMFYYVLCNI